MDEECGKFGKFVERDVMDGQKFWRHGKCVENVATDGQKVGKFGKVVDNVATDGVNIEEKLCKSIMKGLARHNRERHAMLAEMEEESRDVVSVDNITGKELPWHAVRKAREQELKYLRDLGVYEKVDDREAIAKYQLTPIDTKWIDTDKAFEGSQCKSDQELLRENSRMTIDQICMQGPLRWKR